MNHKLKVMLTTEGTYPFHQGGVSTWCDILVKRLPDVDYVIYSIIMNPFVTRKFDLPGSTGLIKVPLWGTEEPSEHLTTPFSQVYLAKRKTDERIIRNEFLPLFRNLITEIIAPEKDSRGFAQTMHQLHRFFQEYDYRNCFKSEITWQLFKDIVFKAVATKSINLAEPSLFSLSQSLGWIYRFLTVLNTPLPKVDVTHSAAAAFCGIPGVLAKMENQTPLLLTEHGVYLREQYLSLSSRGYSAYLNTFLMRLIHSVAGLNYFYADQISPVCHYNTRWEKEFGVEDKRIKVIYNGVDKEVFHPRKLERVNKYPTVVTVARIDPVKDILTLIRAAALVKDRLPEVRFIVYGSVSVPEYFTECKSLSIELGISDSFIFAGHTDDVPAAIQSGDIVALSSISEAFPYSVVESMMSGKAVVATDVGGIREALGETGIVVRPRHPEELAQALTLLLENPSLRLTLGEEARERALNYFTIERVLKLYLDSYQVLAHGEQEEQVIDLKIHRQKLLSIKGYALAAAGFKEQAIAQFRLAVKEMVDSPAVPVLITEIADLYNQMGQFDRAFVELERAETYIRVIVEQKQIA